jgi:hypothetical protein
MREEGEGYRKWDMRGSGGPRDSQTGVWRYTGHPQVTESRAGHPNFNDLAERL